jgi:hypothetical protein
MDTKPAKPFRNVRGLKGVQAALELSSYAKLARLLADDSNGLAALLEHDVRTGETTAVQTELVAWGEVHLKPVPYAEQRAKRSRRKRRSGIVAVAA